jgi:hypothetical protein
MLYVSLPTVYSLEFDGRADKKQRIRGQKCKHINCMSLSYLTLSLDSDFSDTQTVADFNIFLVDALIIILKAPAHLCYQTAFLSDELASIFANAPVTRAPEPEHNHDHAEDNNNNYDGVRKPIDGECPICVFDMDADTEELVWCKASCGQNFHRECFEQWRRSKNGGRVTCVYCRAEWLGEGQTATQRQVPKTGLAALKATAPKVGRYRNIGGHEMYRQEREVEGNC